MKTSDEFEMLDDYSHLAHTARRRDPRYTKEAIANAPIYEIDTDGQRRRVASLSQLEFELSEYTTKDFEVVIEAMKHLARERGEEKVQYILAHCELELMQLRQT